MPSAEGGRAGKLVSPARRRQAVAMLRGRLGVSERWACQVCGQHRSTQRREPTPAADDEALRRELRAFSARRPRWGYRQAHTHQGYLTSMKSSRITVEARHPRLRLAAGRSFSP
jgi:hypothetical protein